MDFYAYLDDVCNNINESIGQSLQNIDDNTNEQHNHPPINYIVPSCKYCKTHGNVFSIPNTNHTKIVELKQYLKCII